jgi:ribose transport system substrate-binding protein
MKTLKLIASVSLAVAIVLALVIFPGCTAEAPAAPAETAPAAPAETEAAAEEPAEAPESGTIAKEDISLGYVIHVAIPFTDSIKRGAEAAAADYGVKIEVVAPSEYDLMEQIALFEGLLTKGVQGITTVSADAAGWQVPIRNAVDDGVIVMTSNVGDKNTGTYAHAGTAGYTEGISLATATLALPEVQALDGKGKIVIGACDPSIPVLQGRVNGFVDTMAENGDWEILGPFDSGMSNEASYTFWETQFSANPDMVMGVGSCAFDVPSMTRHKEKTPEAEYLIIGYDLEPDALNGIINGYASLTQGQHPFLQGYLPTMAIIEHLLNGNPLATGWINVGSEVVNIGNAAELLEREGDPEKEYAFYKDYIAQNFTPIWESAQDWGEFKNTGRE